MIAEWDTVSHMRDVKDHPEKYVTMASILQCVTSLNLVRKAQTMDSLRTIFQAQAKIHKGDMDFMKNLTAVKDERKAAIAKRDETFRKSVGL